jgi:hypothetical protein
MTGTRLATSLVGAFRLAREHNNLNVRSRLEVFSPILLTGRLPL